MNEYGYCTFRDGVCREVVTVPVGSGGSLKARPWVTAERYEQSAGSD